jgi:RHS repeat-associated protein
VVQSYEYESFGALTSRTGILTQPYTYTSREWDAETGLYFYRARYYDPLVGRFISEDPFRLLGDDDVNFYPYVRNNPINATDPLGLFLFGCSKKQDDKSRYDICKNLPPADQARCRQAVDLGCKGPHPYRAVGAIHCCRIDYQGCYAEALRTNNDQKMYKCYQDYQDCMAQARKGNPKPPIIH